MPLSLSTLFASPSTLSKWYVKVIELKLKNQTDFEEGLFHYHEQEFDEALSHFKRVLGVDAGDKAAEHYLKRTNYYLKYGVPTDWDGIEVLTEM